MGRSLGVALPAEIAPHRDDVDPDPLFWYPDRLGQLQTGPERRFAGTPGLDAPVIVDGYDAGEGLDVSLVAAGDGEGVFQNNVCVFKALGQVALGPGEPGLPVVYVLGQDAEGRAFVGFDIVVKQGRVRRHRFPGIEDRGKRFVLDVDQQQRLFGGFRRHRGNPVADVADPVPAEDGQVPKDFAHVETRVVLTGNDSLDAGYAPGRRGIDPPDAGVGMGAAQDLAPEHPWQVDIGSKAGSSGHFVRSLDVGDGRAYDR